MINHDEYKSIRIHWIALHVNGKKGRVSFDATYFVSFGVEHVPKEIKKIIGNKKS